MPRIIFMSRGEYLRGFLLSFACGFFTHSSMLHSASPQWQNRIVTAVAIAVGILSVTNSMRRRRKGPLEEP